MFDILLDTFGLEAIVLRRAALLEIIIWAVMLVAVMIDMRAGIRKARALHQPIDSHGLRRTFTKFGDYGKVTALFMCVDVLGLLFGLYSMPYASGAAAVIAVGIERAREPACCALLGGQGDGHRGGTGQDAGHEGGDRVHPAARPRAGRGCE